MAATNEPVSNYMIADENTTLNVKASEIRDAFVSGQIVRLIFQGPSISGVGTYHSDLEEIEEAPAGVAVGYILFAFAPTLDTNYVFQNNNSFSGMYYFVAENADSFPTYMPNYGSNDGGGDDSGGSSDIT
jgi:hypothetical protein